MEFALNRPFSRFSLSQQFLFACAAILLAGMLIVGLWLQHQIETSVVNRTAAMAAVYVESIVAAQLRSRPLVGPLDGATRADLDRLFAHGPLQRKVVRVKLWGGDGTVLYSTDATQIGQRFPIRAVLAAAFGGEPQASISQLDDPDNHPERRHWDQLIEVYVPVHGDVPGEVMAVAEFYHSTENLVREVRGAQQRGWLLIAATTVATYLLMWGMVRRADHTIVDQQRDLRSQLQRLRTSLDENVRMRRQLREAGERTTALNEQFLHRVAADLHDGPAQEIALALLRIEALAEADSGCSLAKDATRQDFHTIRDAMHSGLEELRAIARGLGNPGLDQLCVADTARRAVRNFERKAGKPVKLDIDMGPEDAPLAVKITLYRVLQESLANGWAHGKGGEQQVRLSQGEGTVRLEVIDHGPGFDPRAKSMAGRLGLAFMKERVRLLGGQLEIDAAPGRGTRVVACIPLAFGEPVHAC